MFSIYFDFAHCSLFGTWPVILMNCLLFSTQPKSCLICRTLSYSFLQSYKEFPAGQLNDILYELCTLLDLLSDYSCRESVGIYMVNKKNKNPLDVIITIIEALENVDLCDVK